MLAILRIYYSDLYQLWDEGLITVHEALRLAVGKNAQ